MFFTTSTCSYHKTKPKYYSFLEYCFYCRVASNAEEAQQVRPARLVATDLIVRPYNYNDACGAKIFNETDRGRYADTDYFVAHAFINEKSVFIVTDR